MRPVTYCGMTTAQMVLAPIGSVFVWCNENLDYPCRLAVYVNRSDLSIVSPVWLLLMSRHGRIPRQCIIVVDHALSLTPERRQAIDRFRCAGIHVRGVDTHATVNSTGDSSHA